MRGEEYLHWEARRQSHLHPTKLQVTLACFLFRVFFINIMVTQYLVRWQFLRINYLLYLWLSCSILLIIIMYISISRPVSPIQFTANVSWKAFWDSPIPIWWPPPWPSPSCGWPSQSIILKPSPGSSLSARSTQSILWSSKSLLTGCHWSWRYNEWRTEKSNIEQDQWR